ncbi:MAG: biotin transporter BioY [Roseburia sp.]|nr:biotin transporter BioY [Roseburia sp.]
MELRKNRADAYPLPQNQDTKFTAKDLAVCALFTALIAVGAYIKIPIPALPFTLQFFFVILAGLLLGSKRGAVSAGVYLLLGLAGAPVFTEGGGVWYVLKPSFGYLIGFVIAAYVAGRLAEGMERLGFWKLMGVNLVGLLIVYAAGMAYYYVICNYVIHTPVGVGTLFLYCFVLVVPGDIFLSALAAIVAKRIKPVLRSMGY